MARHVLSPLRRVEGHGRVDLLMDGTHLQGVEVRLIEAPRLFEAMVVGRSWSECPDLVCRICSICSAVHKLAALSALEKAMGVPVPETGRLVRELLLLGGHLQSHALHLFCLILPDLVGRASVLELVAEQDPAALAGMRLKAFGNRLQEIAGGRVVHPVNPVFGGVRARPGQQELSILRDELEACDEEVDGWMGRFADPACYPAAMHSAGEPLAVGCGDEFVLEAGQLTLASGESIAVSDYAELLNERSVAYSHAKQSTASRGAFLVGALARLRVAACGGEKRFVPAQELGIHGNNAAQVWEIGWMLERVRQIIDQLSLEDIRSPLNSGVVRPQAGVGTVAYEAPRGLLVHHYVVDDWGQVVSADIVTPTAINQQAIEQQILNDLADCNDVELMRKSAERIVRAYDPCISCAVHLLSVND